MIVHWRSGSSGASRLVAHPLDALADHVRCASRIHGLAAVDSAIRVRPDLHAAIADAGLLLDGVDGVCESGIESIAWLRILRRLGARRQVHIPTVGRVDFLIGSRLVVEVDGRAFHDTDSSFESDRRRDALLSALGYRALRFSYRQVVERWAEVEAAIRAAIGRGDHF